MQDKFKITLISKVIKKKTENTIYSKMKRPTEMIPEMSQMFKLANNDFKATITSVLMENILAMNEKTIISDEQ